MILKFNYKSVVLTVFFCVSLLGFSQNNIKESNIVKAVDKHIESAIELIKTAVNINSGTMNFDGVRAVGSFFK